MAFPAVLGPCRVEPGKIGPMIAFSVIQMAGETTLNGLDLSVLMTEAPGVLLLPGGEMAATAVAFRVMAREQLRVMVVAVAMEVRTGDLMASDACRSASLMVVRKKFLPIPYRVTASTIR